MQKHLYSSLVLATLGTSPLCSAETDHQPINLPETTVTATRNQTPVDELATASTIYTRADIEQLQVNTLPELLQRSTGIDMTQSGGYGKITGLFMRGTNSNQMLVLIDGIKSGSVTLGTTPFELIPIDQIERVEITRGPNSSLYGSEAIGGVIQIFTRKGKQNATPSVTLDAGAGSFDTVQGAGSVSGKWQNNWYSLSASHFNSQGINARSIGDPDRDGLANTGLNARLGHHFDNNAEVEAFYLRNEGRTDIDSPSPGNRNKTLFTNQVVGISGSLDFSQNWRSTLRLGQSRDDSDNLYPDTTYDSRFYSTRWNASWLNDIALSENHRLSFGSDYRVDEIDSTTQYIKTSRYDLGIFSQLHSRIWQRNLINASLRWDENQAFGDYVTGNFGWRYNWDSGLSAFANFGNAFKAPTLNDLYYVDRWGSHGDPSLKPEQSTSFEVGLSGQYRRASWQARAYHTDIDNLITWYTDPSSYISQPIQTQKAQIDGAEFETNLQLLGWNNKLSLNFLHARDRETNLRLPRRADTVINYDLSRSFGAVDVGGNILVRGNTWEQHWDGARSQVDGFATIDLRTAYHLDKHWMLSARLNNLLDKQYQTVDTYNTFGRNFFFTIHFNN